VEQRIKPTGLLGELREGTFGGVRIGDIAGQGDGIFVAICDFVQALLAARQQADTPASVQKFQRRGAPDAGTGTGDQDGFHSLSSISSFSGTGLLRRSSMRSACSGLDRRLRTTQCRRSSARVMAT